MSFSNSWRILRDTSFIADHFADDAMRRIDALTEQRVAAARAELLAQIRELEQAGVNAIRFAHQWIAGLPISPSFQDKRAAQEALERAETRVRALADKLTEAK